MSIDWEKNLAAVFRPTQGRLKPVSEIDAIYQDDLVGIERQKGKIIANTEAFLSKKSAMDIHPFS